MDNLEFLRTRTIERVATIQTFIGGAFSKYGTNTSFMDDRDKIHFSTIRKIAADNLRVNFALFVELSDSLEMPRDLSWDLEIAKKLNVNEELLQILLGENNVALH